MCLGAKRRTTTSQTPPPSRSKASFARRSTIARRPVPPSTPPRENTQRFGHRKLYYSPYKGLAYGIATPSVMKFVRGLKAGSDAMAPSAPILSFESGNTTFIRPISRPVRPKARMDKTAARVRVEPQHLSDDPYWNVNPFRPGAVERRFVCSDQVRNALTWAC